MRRRDLTGIYHLSGERSNHWAIGEPDAAKSLLWKLLIIWIIKESSGHEGLTLKPGGVGVPGEDPGSNGYLFV